MPEPEMTRADELYCDQQGRTVWLTLNRPAVHNALSRSLLKSLLAQLRSARMSEDTSAIVVTGVGDTFSSGLDLNEFPTTADCQQTLSCTALQLVLAEMRDSPVPIVVALNGPAFAGGAGVALAADFLVLPEDAFLQFPGAGKGIVAEVLMPILVDTVGPRRGLDWLIRGKKIQAQELQMCGIAVEVVPKAELSQATRALCDLLEAIPATVFATHKQLLSRTLYQDDQAGLSWTHPFQPVIHFAPTSRLPGAR